VRGPGGEVVHLMSGAEWRVRRDDDLEVPVTLRRRQWVDQTDGSGEVAIDVDPAFTHLWRRPHPLPGASWLEDTADDDTVLPVVPDAFAGRERMEWFRWTLPPGATSMTLPLHGVAHVWVDGVELPVSDGQVGLPPSPVAKRTILLRVVPEPGRTGGAVFDGPVTYRVVAGPVELEPWAQLGLEAYSGSVRYRTSVMLDAGLGGPLTLDVGRIRGTAEVWINGEAVGTRVWSPYRFDITAAAKPGLNTVEVLVCNTLAPYLSAASPTPYIFPGHEISGLFGPVTIEQAQPATEVVAR